MGRCQAFAFRGDPEDTFFIVKRFGRRPVSLGKNVKLGYSRDEMFEVVFSCRKTTHNFVPWCKKSHVTFRDQDRLLAELVIGFPPLFGESYNSHVTLFKPHLVCAVCTDMAMFQHLKTVWKFEPIPDQPYACKLDFAVSFAFKSSVHTYLAKRFFDEVIKQNVKAFLDEAQRKFGPERPFRKL